MAKSFIDIIRSAFTPLSESDCRAYSQYVNPRKNVYDVGASSVESIVGEGDPSLSEGFCLSVKQQRIMRRSVHVHV